LNITQPTINFKHAPEHCKHDGIFSQKRSQLCTQKPSPVALQAIHQQNNNKKIFKLKKK